jgi:hypothetical protein
MPCTYCNPMATHCAIQGRHESVSASSCYSMHSMSRTLNSRKQPPDTCSHSSHHVLSDGPTIKTEANRFFRMLEDREVSQSQRRASQLKKKVLLYKKIDVNFCIQNQPMMQSRQVKTAVCDITQTEEHFTISWFRYC